MPWKPREAMVPRSQCGVLQAAQELEEIQVTLDLVTTCRSQVTWRKVGLVECVGED